MKAVHVYNTFLICYYELTKPSSLPYSQNWFILELERVHLLGLVDSPPLYSRVHRGASKL